eukprot:980540-Rhodomonas_salina.2
MLVITQLSGTGFRLFDWKLDFEEIAELGSRYLGKLVELCVEHAEDLRALVAHLSNHTLSQQQAARAQAGQVCSQSSSSSCPTGAGSTTRMSAPSSAQHARRQTSHRNSVLSILVICHAVQVADILGVVDHVRDAALAVEGTVSVLVGRRGVRGVLEGPASMVVYASVGLLPHRMHDRDANRILQTLHLQQRVAPIRPRARQRDVQVVAVRLGRELRITLLLRPPPSIRKPSQASGHSSSQPAQQIAKQREGEDGKRGETEPSRTSAKPRPRV